jgi:hypothetical protein
MITAAAVTVFSLGANLSVTAAWATDIVNQDQTAYALQIVDADGARTMEIAPTSEVQGACNGCTITLEGEDPIPAGENDVVLILDGALSVQE